MTQTLSDQQIERLIGTTHSTDVPSRYIRMMASEIAYHRRMSKCRNRSIQQNSRLWAILTDISEQLPDENGKHYSPETWLSFFKARFLGKDTMIVDGEVHLVEKRSSKLKVLDFGDFMHQIEVFAIDHNVNFYQGVA